MSGKQVAVKVLLVDGHPLLRNGLRHAMARVPQLHVAGEAGTGAEALKLAAKTIPELMLVDTHLPDTSGIELARQILSQQPATKIILLSDDLERSLADEALRVGAWGYLDKQSTPEELLRAISQVVAGNLYLNLEIATAILEDYRRSLRKGTWFSKPLLSERERQVLRLVVEGRRNKEIASSLDISVKSIETYRLRLMKKTGCSSIAELVRYAIRERIAAA